MAFEYQVYLCLMLITRLIYLRKDAPAGWHFAICLGVSQCCLVLLIFGFGAQPLLACATVMVFTIIGGGLEGRLSLVWCRLVSLAGLVLVPVSFYPLAGNFTFTPLATHAGELWNQVATVLIGHERIDHSRFVSVSLALLLLANEVNIAMRGIIHACGLVPILDHSVTSDPIAAGTDRIHTATDIREYNAGRIIGILERWLMFLVVLLADDWGALGFIIAAKGLVRLEKLKDPVFAEYMLVGTLLSALFAIAVAWLVR